MSSRISRERKWLFIHPQRTGGTSVMHALQDLFDDLGGEGEHAYLSDFNIDPQDYFKFMMVRNPWHRCASYVAWHIQHGSTPPMHRAIKSLMPLCCFGLDEMDFVLRCEHLENDFAGLCLRLRIELRQVHHLNASQHRDHRSYFNAATRRLVAERFAPEIERFGYEF